MAPKPKNGRPSTMDTRKQLTIAISDSNFLQIPDGAIKGYEERIYQGVEWTFIEGAALHHKLRAKKKLPKINFTQALQKCISKSILKGIVSENSGLTLQELVEYDIPMTIWDAERGGNEQNICFLAANSITDSKAIKEMIKKAVAINNKNVIYQELKLVTVLRVCNANMTHLDISLATFNNIVSLSLCGNYLSELDTTCLPRKLQMLELQANHLTSLDFFHDLPKTLLYLGLARNLLTNDSLENFGVNIPQSLISLDLSENDIYNLVPVLDTVENFGNLQSLLLKGNPCAVCMAYARMTFFRLPMLQFLDYLESPFVDQPLYGLVEPNRDELRFNIFVFNVIRVMGVPPVPPKLNDKGTQVTFHIEIELPLLDITRRNFLMFRRFESLVEFLPEPESGWPSAESLPVVKSISNKIPSEELDNEEETIYSKTAPNEHVVRNYTIFESLRVPFKELMTFQEPVVKIICTNLTILRDTLRSVITAKLIYTATSSGKPKTKSMLALTGPQNSRVVLASMKINLQTSSFNQTIQYFQWDEEQGTDEAIRSDTDLSVLQYAVGTGPIPASKLPLPHVITCHFSVETKK